MQYGGPHQHNAKSQGGIHLLTCSDNNRPPPLKRTQCLINLAIQNEQKCAFACSIGSQVYSAQSPLSPKHTNADKKGETM